VAVIVTFLVFLLTFVVIGIYAAQHKRESTIDDYLLAGRNVGPWFTGLSAMATNASGFYFVGLIGTTYTSGISAAWIMVGWTFGAYITWFVIPERLREQSVAQDAKTIPAFLGGAINGRLPRSTAALATLLFLGAYASAQLSAGSKVLQVLFGWDYSAGAVIGAVIVLIYCFSGGIRASIWTDVAQAFVMLGSILMLAVAGLNAAGGFASLWRQLEAIDPQLVQLVPDNLPFGFGLYLLGWFGAGAGMIGQPHIMVRMMAVRRPQDLRISRHVYFLGNAALSTFSITAALCCRVLLSTDQAFDPELALPMLGLQLLPAVLVGLLIAGLFASTMSTADSQVLVCSSAITQDLFPAWRDSYAKAKLGTVFVTAVMLAIALNAGESVFAMVIMAWGALAAAFGPLMVVRCFGWKASPQLATAMMLASIAAVIVWRFALNLSGAMYEVLPGMIAGFAVYFIGRAIARNRG
jgi:sodium/proline symporter